MKIGTYLRTKQPDILDKLYKANFNKQDKKNRNKNDHLSFKDLKNMMEEGPAYKRHGGALRQVKRK